MLKALTQHLTGRTEKGKECCVRTGGHQADIIKWDITHTRLERHTLILIIYILGSKSKNESKYFHAVCNTQT